MSEQIREQVSAFLDGELPNSETELLLKRLTLDAELRERFGRYALIGESLRGGGTAHLTPGFTARVNRAIDGEVAVTSGQAGRVSASVWWHPFAGATIAAGVAAVAFVSFQERSAVSPVAGSPPPMTAQTVTSATATTATVGGDTPHAMPFEALSYTVPASVPDAPAAMPAARLTNYVFAHSKYSSVLGQNDVLNDLLSEADGEDAGSRDESRDVRVAP